ncbi:hypothetical protein IG631_02826 [Alternaria alternata]|nr:hypothetical protein IG631_02826 [Alternaria alternata]
MSLALSNMKVTVSLDHHANWSGFCQEGVELAPIRVCTKVERKAIQTNILCVENILTDIVILEATHHVVCHSAQRSVYVNIQHQVTYIGLSTTERGVTRPATALAIRPAANVESNRIL